MELDEPYHEALDAQRNNEGQSQQANQTPPSANIEITTLQIMQQMMRQMSELTARIAKIETTSTLHQLYPPTPAVDATPPPAMPAPPREPKGLKDPDAFDGTRSQYLPWKYQIEAKLRSEPRRFHTNQLAIDYTFSRTTGDARARVFPWVSIHAASSTLDEFFRHLDEAFKDPHMAETARNKLQNMRQKTHNVRDFMQDFNKEALTAGLFDHAILKTKLERIPIPRKPIVGVNDQVSWVDEVAKFNFDINGYTETGFAYITPNDAEEDIILGRPWMDRNKELESAVKKARLTRSKSEKSALLNFNG
ncbi:Gag [Pyrenophora tritici-repentis]|nr:Gag [Pyrenophora tritici-repentis]